MNAKSNSMEIPVTRMATGRVRRGHEPVAAIAIALAVRSEEIARFTELRRGLAWQPGHHGTGEFWETLGHLALWLCGLTAIGFSLALF
jgi:hypothetical protein